MHSLQLCNNSSSYNSKKVFLEISIRWHFTRKFTKFICVWACDLWFCVYDYFCGAICTFLSWLWKNNCMELFGFISLWLHYCRLRPALQSGRPWSPVTPVWTNCLSDLSFIHTQQSAAALWCLGHLFHATHLAHCSSTLRTELTYLAVGCCSEQGAACAQPLS